MVTWGLAVRGANTRQELLSRVTSREFASQTVVLASVSSNFNLKPVGATIGRPHNQPCEIISFEETERSVKPSLPPGGRWHVKTHSI